MTINEAKRNQSEIADYFGNRHITSVIKTGKDEKNVFGYIVEYILTN